MTEKKKQELATLKREIRAFLRNARATAGAAMVYLDDNNVKESSLKASGLSSVANKIKSKFKKIKEIENV